MQFQHPSFLWALSLLAIPILIHLFNLRRYKTVYFSDIRFLKDVQQSTKKQRKLKEWLVLLARMLAISALVLAFAKPFLPQNSAVQKSTKALVIFDNSASSSVGKQQSSPFERGKQLALNLLEEISNDIEISLFATNYSSVQSSSKAILTEELKTLDITDRSLNMPAEADLSKSTVYFISDLQKNSLRFLNANFSAKELIIIPTIADDEVDFTNVCVDSVWTETPFLLAGQPIPFFIKLKNYGTHESDVNIELSANDLPEISLSKKLRANGDTVVKTALTQLKSGHNTVQISILNDEVAFDNRYSLSYFLPLSNRVVEVYSDKPSPLLQKIFAGNEFEFTATPSATFSAEQLHTADLIILNGLENLPSGLAKTLQSQNNNPNLFIIPSVKNPSSLNDLLAALGGKTFGNLDTAKLATQRVNTADPFFQEVFAGSLENSYWPTVRKHFKLTGASKLPSFTLLTLANGDPLFVRYASKSAQIYQLALPLDAAFSDISTHPIIVPLFIKALVKKDNISNLTGIVGVDSRFELMTNSVDEVPLSVSGFKNDFIPRQQKNGSFTSIIAGAEIVRSGNYNVLNGEEIAASISFNTPEIESDLQRYTVSELQDFIDDNKLQNVHILRADAASLKKQLNEWQQGIQLWKFCLLAALLFVLIEVILLRFLK